MNTVIYYPYIFPSSQWLKIAALCWNKVYRLVPDKWSYDPIVDPDEVMQLDSELGGILENVEAKKIASPRVDEQFIRWLREHRLELIHERMLDDQADEIGFDEGNTVFFKDKASIAVIDSLVRSGYKQEGPYFFLPRYIAHYYLSLCASEAAKKYKSDPITDEKKYTDIIFDSSPIYGEVATAVLQAYLPENLFNLEPERLKEFRVNSATERLRYQAEIQNIVDKYTKVSSVGELETVKKQIIEIAKDEVENINNKFVLAKQKLVLKSFTIALTPPALAASIASILGIGIFAPVGIIAALSLFAANTLVDWNEATSAKFESPWSYVLDAARI
jgi:hypothetical protein